MTIRHLHIFIEVYRQLNITRASENLHMTQPAVTRAIQELEHYYGVRLFERMNRRLYITDSGEKLYNYALHIDDTFCAMENMLRDMGNSGVLRVGASVMLGNYTLPELITRFKQICPGTTVRVEICNSAKLQQYLLDNRLDIALIEGVAGRRELVCEQFASDNLELIVPPGHPLLTMEHVLLADLANYELLLREEGSAGRVYIDSLFAIRGITPEPAWQSTSTQAIVRAVAAGLGISILPNLLVKDDISCGKVCSRGVDDEKFIRPLFAVWHKNKYLTGEALKFIELCKKQ